MLVLPVDWFTMREAFEKHFSLEGQRGSLVALRKAIIPNCCLVNLYNVVNIDVIL